MRVAALLDAVKQVVVEVASAGLLELLVKDLVAILKAIEEAVMELGGQRKALARIAIDEGLLGNALACKAVVHPGGIKVGEALGHKQVDHLLDLLNVDRRTVGGVGLRQTHEAKAELLCRNKIHRSPLSRSLPMAASHP